MSFERKKKNTKITNLRHYLPAFNNGGVSNRGKHLFLTKLNSRNCFQREITLFITNWLFEYLIMSDFLLFIKKKNNTWIKLICRIPNFIKLFGFFLVWLSLFFLLFLGQFVLETHTKLIHKNYIKQLQIRSRIFIKSFIAITGKLLDCILSQNQLHIYWQHTDNYILP